MATTSPYRTESDLVDEVLANLGVLSAGQPVDPEDYSYVQEKLPAVFRMLAALEICYAPDSNNIPGAWFSPLADILAGECCTKFGVTNDDFVKLTNKGLGGAGSVSIGAGTAAQALKIMTRGRPTREPLRTESF
jgi:hypothetical protein